MTDVPQVGALRQMEELHRRMSSLDAEVKDFDADVRKLDKELGELDKKLAQFPTCNSCGRPTLAGSAHAAHDKHVHLS